MNPHPSRLSFLHRIRYQINEFGRSGQFNIVNPPYFAIVSNDARMRLGYNATASFVSGNMNPGTTYGINVQWSNPDLSGLHGGRISTTVWSGSVTSDGATNTVQFTVPSDIVPGSYDVYLYDQKGETVQSLSGTMVVPENYAYIQSFTLMPGPQTNTQSLNLQGIIEPHTTYKVEASTNLVDWEQIGTTSDPGDSEILKEPAVGLVAEKYRDRAFFRLEKIP
jgi:hypothetical protein